MRMLVARGSLVNASLFLLSFQDKKPKLSMGESMKFLFNSRYVRDLATLVVAYGVSINLVEVTWKGKIKAQVSDTRANLCWSFQPTRFMVATGPGIQ